MADGRNNSVPAPDRRYSPREEVEPISIKGFTSLDHMTLISRTGEIVDASKSGFLLKIDRKALVPKEFREALSLDGLIGDRVILTIDKMNLEVGGKIVRAKRIGKEGYEIAIDFSEDAPEYWRECLLDLLPRPGEMRD
jgi:hypothetical protein